MPITVKTHVAGLSEARRLLKQLPEKVQNKVLIDSVRAGTDIIHKAVKASAPQSTNRRSKASYMYGHLKENIRMFKLKFNVPEETVIFRVNTGDAFWARFLEYGTRFMPARPWFRPAVDANAERAVSAMKEKLAQGIEREAMKLISGGR